MARSVKRDDGVMEYDGLGRFRRRRLLAFLRRNNLPATFDAMKHETRAFFDVQFLQRLVVDGRWQEARGYVNRFLPSRSRDREEEDKVLAEALRFIAQLNVLDDLHHGKLDAADDLEMQIKAIPAASTMADDDPHYAEAVRTVFFNARSRPLAYCRGGPVDWQLVRRKASQIVKDLITQAPRFKHLMRRLPQCTIHFGFRGCPTYTRRNKIGHMPASLLAQRFHKKERRGSPSPWTQGSLSKPMDLQELIDEALLAGKQDTEEHSDSCEGIPGSPVGPFMGKSCGISPADAVKKCSDQEYHAESASSSAELPWETREFYSDGVSVSSVGIDPMFVLKKMSAIGEISGAMLKLLTNTCIGPDHYMFVQKLMEQQDLFHELRVHCINSKI